MAGLHRERSTHSVTLSTADWLLCFTHTVIGQTDMMERAEEKNVATDEEQHLTNVSPVFTEQEEEEEEECSDEEEGEEEQSQSPDREMTGWRDQKEEESKPGSSLPAGV